MSISNVILAAFSIYAIATVVAFRLLPPLTAALLSLFAGWLLLPVADFPASLAAPGHFDDVIGIVLPGSLLFTKALVCPVVVFACLAVTVPERLRRFRPGGLDLAMAAFCLSPLVAWGAGHIPAGSALMQCGYLAGAWGALWMTGRLLLDDEAGRQGLSGAIIASGLALVPIALVEGPGMLNLYSALYGPHPYQNDGSLRYFGFRPLGFFENGNQYGIWIALTALVAIGRMLARRTPRDGTIAAVLVAAALGSQSVGAIILLVLGAAWLVASPHLRRIGIAAALLLGTIGGAGYLSGKLPIEHWAKGTAPGQFVYNGLRSVGRGSFGWKVKRDQVALPMIQQAALTGYGRWDWWRPLHSRPSGVPLLLVGQFGVLSLLCLALAMFGGAIRELIVGRSNVLAVTILAAGVDAWLNSFVFYPAILAAAALARPVWRSQPRAGEVPAAMQPGAAPTGAVDAA
ncbi:MAG: hypothetical protein KGM17_02700 [Sphingomonadales bacterium]|nr:hypothetical protein [Sphingomonadales bacterium]